MREQVVAGVMWELSGNALCVTGGAPSAPSVHTAFKIRDCFEGTVLPISQLGFRPRRGTGWDRFGPANIDVSNLFSLSAKKEEKGLEKSCRPDWD